MRFVVSILLICMCSIYVYGEPKKVCVLYHERTVHPFMKDINQVFGKNTQVLLIKEAVPVDILKCLEADVEDILIFSHAFEISDEGDTRLGYFTKNTDVKSQEKYKKALRVYSDLHYEHKRQLIRPCVNKHSADYPCSDEEIFAYEVQITYFHLSRMKRSDLIYKLVFEYEKKVFNQRPFVLLRDAIRKNPNHRLKRIRLMSCEPKKIFKAYPALREILNENDIVLDIAPKNKFFSFLFGKHVTTVNKDWLRRSLN